MMRQKGIKAQLVDENDATEENEVVYKPRVSANNGIAGNINGYEYRILKIFNGGLPAPVSKPRRDYYSQEHLKEYKPLLPGLADNKTKNITSKANLVYLWDIVDKHIILYLVIPKHHLLYLTTALTLIPNPITTMKQAIMEEGDIETQHITQVVRAV